MVIKWALPSKCLKVTVQPKIYGHSAPAFILHFLWKLPSVLLCLQSLPQRMTTGTLRGSWRYSASWANIPTSLIWSEPARTEVRERPLVALLCYVLTLERGLFKCYYSSRGTAKIAEFQAVGYFTNVHLFGQAGRLDHLLCVVKNSAQCVYNIRTKLSIQLIVYSVQHVEVFQIQTDTPADLISSAPGNHLIVTNLNNPWLPKAFFTFTFVWFV